MEFKANPKQSLEYFRYLCRASLHPRTHNEFPKLENYNHRLDELERHFDSTLSRIENVRPDVNMNTSVPVERMKELEEKIQPKIEEKPDELPQERKLQLESKISAKLNVDLIEHWEENLKDIISKYKELKKTGKYKKRLEKMQKDIARVNKIIRKLKDLSP